MISAVRTVVPGRIRGVMMSLFAIMVFMGVGVSAYADAPARTTAAIDALVNGITVPPVVITEFNYNSPFGFDTDDWVELYNNGPDPVDLSEFIFTDNEEGHFFLIPDNTTLAPWSYLILCRELDKFRYLNPDMETAIGDFPFGLSGGGESMMLYNAAGALVDSVFYDDKDPWPVAADGRGSTLELINPSMDNNTLHSWAPSDVEHGTPGARNSIYITSVESGRPWAFTAGPAYPNPFNPATTIPFTLTSSVHVRIEVFSALGQRVALLVDRAYPAGAHAVTFDARRAAAGLYIWRVQAGNATRTGSVLLVK